MTIGSATRPRAAIGQTAEAESTDRGQPDDGVRRTVRRASSVFVGTTALLLVVLLWRTRGTFVYVVDDAAIHLTVARRLALHGTWGVVPGEFQAASSSPLWTLLLAPTQLVLRGRVGEWVPLVLNVAAGLWVIRLLGPDLHRALRPSDDRPLGLLATAGVVIALLFLPALAFFGMEHTLHLALVLATTLAVERRWVNGATGVAGERPAPPAWVPFLLLGLATLTRNESAFVAVGLAVGLVVVRAWAPDRQRPRRASMLEAGRAGLPLAAGFGLVVVAAVGGMGVVNLAFGQGLLPNSVLAKTFGDRADTGRTIAAAFERLTTDPLLLTLFLVALVVVVVTVRSRSGGGGVRTSPGLFPAVVMVVSALLHVELAAVTRSFRYEAYLVGLGMLTVLRLLASLGWEAAHAGHTERAGQPGRLVARVGAAGLLLLVPVASLQVYRTVTVPWQANVLWEQRYQMARFLHDSYRTEPIAIGELGYIGLYHDGPLTDVYGLGDHEVLEATLDHRKDADFWRQLHAERGFRVVVTYDFALGGQQPDGWFPVASWRSPDAYYEVTRFWATTADEVVPLRQALEAYEPGLPADVEVTYNDLAPLAAATELHQSG